MYNKIGSNSLAKCLTVRSDWFYQVTEMPMEQDQVHHAQDNAPLPETNINSGHHQVMQVFPPVPTSTENAPQQTFHPNDSSSNLVQFVPVTFQTKPTFNLNTTDAQLSLNLSLSSSFNLNEQSNSRHSAFVMIPSFSDGDSNSSSIRVA